MYFGIWCAKHFWKWCRDVGTGSEVLNVTALNLMCGQYSHVMRGCLDMLHIQYDDVRQYVEQHNIGVGFYMQHSSMSDFTHSWAINIYNGLYIHATCSRSKKLIKGRQIHIQLNAHLNCYTFLPTKYYSEYITIIFKENHFFSSLL